MNIRDEFFYAIRIGDTDQVEAILGIEPNLIHATNSKGYPPLVLSTYNEQVEMTNLLLEKGVDINAQDRSGNTALMGVIFKGFEKLAVLLVKAGADVNVRNHIGATALIFAATFGRTKLAKLLLEHGANADIQDNHGNTAFKHAQMQGNQSFLDLLPLRAE